MYVGQVSRTQLKPIEEIAAAMVLSGCLWRPSGTMVWRWPTQLMHFSLYRWPPVAGETIHLELVERVSEWMGEVKVDERMKMKARKIV